MTFTKERAAVETLESKGYTWHGGQFWKPPIGKAPAYITGEQSVVTPDAAVESLATDLMKRIDKITGERHSIATLSSLRVSIVEACCAAMLQGAEQQNRQQNIPENIPATQFKPVADLYGLTSPTGSETSFTFDAVEARDFIDGGWLCQEYVELERFQEAITNHTEDKLAMVDHSGDSNNMVESVTTACELRDAVDAIRNSGIAIDGEKILAERDALNSPVIPDGWVACVERMPSAGEQVLAYRPDAPESNDPLIKMATYVGGSAHGHGFDCYCKPTHWMPLPAAPQQEVTQALAKGMERYGDAMQKLADSGD